MCVCTPRGDSSSAVVLQVTTPEVQHGSRAEPEHLQRLTEYVAHLESSAGAS